VEVGPNAMGRPVERLACTQSGFETTSSNSSGVDGWWTKSARQTLFQVANEDLDWKHLVHRSVLSSRSPARNYLDDQVRIVVSGSSQMATRLNAFIHLRKESYQERKYVMAATPSRLRTPSQS
jgi:hypothetical protein